MNLKFINTILSHYNYSDSINICDISNMFLKYEKEIDFDNLFTMEEKELLEKDTKTKK